MQRTVECFYPGRSFPAISTTGRTCALDCKHCAGKYLEGMISAPSPEDLLSLADALAERGASGFLLSGGADSSGRVHLARFEHAIEAIKSTTDLRINAHIGLAPRGEVARLVRAGVDAFSVDVYGSAETVHDVLGLRATPDDYLGVVRDLVELGAPVVAPHICIGIHEGKLGGEFAAIERLRPLEPRALVMISFMPTKGTEYQSVRPPRPEDILSVVDKARSELPDTKLVLGCMRSKMNRAWESDAVDRGLDGIVLPSRETVERLRGQGVNVRKRSLCCALI